MNITIVGAGAIGTLLSEVLIRVGEHVTLVARPYQVATLRAQGLVVQRNGGHETVHPRAVVSGLDDGVTSSTDVVILTVKAYDTESVARDLARLRTTPFVLTVQNGVGNEETLAAHLHEERILAGALTTPVEVRGPGHIVIARPSFRLGLSPVVDVSPAWEIVHALGKRFVTGGFRVQYVRDYRSLKWTKLLMNMTANAQCALLGWTPRQVFAHPVAGALEVRAWREALAVMRHLGVRPIAFGGYPLPLVIPLIERLPIAVVRRLMGRFVAGGRGTKMPSVYLEVQRGRERTEVPWLNGAVARYAAELGVPAPVNTALTRLIAAVVGGTSPWEEIRGRPERILQEVERHEHAGT